MQTMAKTAAILVAVTLMVALASRAAGAHERETTKQAGATDEAVLAAQQEADRHEQMMAAYRGLGKPGQRMEEHCAHLVWKYRRQAKTLAGTTRGHADEGRPVAE